MVWFCTKNENYKADLIGGLNNIRGTLIHYILVPSAAHIATISRYAAQNTLLPEDTQ